MNVKRLLIYLAVFLSANAFSISAYAQKYFFQHFDIESGLLQSQVAAITQDKNNQLWLSTLGGVNCFDSRQFTAFTVEDGLSGNDNFALATDKNGQVWSGNSKGITAFDRNGIKNYSFFDRVNNRGVRQVIIDDKNNKWALTGYTLFKLINGKLKKQFVITDGEMVSAIQLNNKREIYAAVYKKGIYKLENNAWLPVLSFGTANGPANSMAKYISYFIFDNAEPGKIYFIANNQIYVCSKGQAVAENPLLFKGKHTELTCLLPDNENGLWIGTDNGAYLFKNNKLTFFDESNGFTNARIFCIFKDNVNNVWFGTDGSGLYQYPGNSLLIFDKTQGLNNNIVMGLVKSNKDEVFISTFGNGIYSCKNNSISKVNLGGSDLENKKINCLYEDSQNTLWAGTDYGELWKKTGQVVTRIFPQGSEKSDGLFSSILKDSDNKLWAATGRGCFYLKNDKLVKINGIDGYCTSLLEIGKDSMLVASETGVKLISNNQAVTGYQPGFPNILVLCLHSYGNFLLAGTNDRGIFIWNKNGTYFQNITTKQGLNSNSVFSMQIDDNQLWVGTGRGVNKFILNQKENYLAVARSPFSGILCECNENAMLRIGDYMGVGTTHGLNLYPVNKTIYQPAPNIVIENVQTYSAQLKDTAYSFENGYKLPRSLSLPSGESHISIKFQAIQYNGIKSSYEYKLDGLDANYSKPVQNNIVDYPNLPPSTYIFKVKTVTDNGAEGNPVSYSFTIVPAFYQTIAFRIVVILLLLFIIIIAFRYKIYLAHKKNVFINQLRLIEQENVRRQTAEDFHDDLGNKLTRINMLSELLDKKISRDLADQKKIIHQIRAGVAEMYSGTKNILWALNPKNDRLSEIVTEVKNFSECLFEEMNISFTIMPYENDLDRVKLPLGFSHNLILIFKELINNILKHADANTVTFSIVPTSYNEICFTITDDGKGYQNENVFPGNGLRNIQNRSKKLNGKIIISSQPGKGTITKLFITVP